LARFNESQRRFFSKGSFKVGYGENTRFWEDTLLGAKPLDQQFPTLFNIVQLKQVSVASVLSQVPLHITFSRALAGNKWSQWLQLFQMLMQVQLCTKHDVFV
jgi:hypothetical protein